MTDATRTDALERLRLAIIGCSDIEQDSSLPGRLRLRAAGMKKHLLHVESALKVKPDPNAHLGGRSDAMTCEDGHD